jgi:ribulose-5-phosphate 4-epimerase/fuculose-1-phosphate aldolase
MAVRMMLEAICKLLRDAYDKNWITSRDGNISWKPEGADYFYITPSGVRKQELTPDQFKKISLKDLTILDDNNLTPSGEIHLHHGLLKQTDQEHFVVHLHPTYTVAAMHKGINLSNLINSFPELSRYTSIAPTVHR